MKNYNLIIDWMLIATFAMMVTSKFIAIPFARVIQPIFFILIVIHITQHFKIITHSIKKRFKTKKQSNFHDNIK